MSHLGETIDHDEHRIVTTNKGGSVMKSMEKDTQGRLEIGVG